MPHQKFLQDRIVLVTGASRGIGRAVALEAAREGAHVIAVARTAGALEALDDEIKAVGAAATLVPVNMTDYAGLDRLGAAIFERWGRLDGLVGNAGVLGPLSPLGHVDPKAFEEVMAVNVTANYRLIRSMDPLLRRSDAGRAVFMSSSAAHKGRAFWGPYATSKAAIEMIGRSWADEHVNGKIRVNLVNPGPLRTRMRAAAMPGEKPETLRTPEDFAPKVVAMLHPELKETGRLYDFRVEKWVDFRAPE